MTVPQIMLMQEALKQRGLYNGKIDGIFGNLTSAAFSNYINGLPHPTEQPHPVHDETGSAEVRSVLASSFADLADVAAFQRCKNNGGSDGQCFRIGDNGVGFSAMPVENDNTWVPIEGDTDGQINCADENIPCAALPPEVWLAKWGSVKNAAGKRIIVTHEGTSVAGILGDTMPHLRNITNGCLIDLNPGFAKAFGLHPPFKAPVTWRWA